MSSWVKGIYHLGICWSQEEDLLMAVCPHQEFHTSIAIAVVVAAGATETAVAVATHIDRARRWETLAYYEMRLSSLGHE